MAENRPPVVTIQRRMNAKTGECEVHYKRLIGRDVTHHVIADGSLSLDDIELFRTNPLALCPPEPASAA